MHIYGIYARATHAEYGPYNILICRHFLIYLRQVHFRFIRVRQQLFEKYIHKDYCYKHYITYFNNINSLIPSHSSVI